ncbi:MAG: AI-2E family transporter [Candidatus Falkowbacteria bacterium]
MPSLKKNQTNYAFIALLLLCVVLTLNMLQGFFQLLGLAAILAIMFLPVHRFLVKHLKNETASALLTVFGIVALVVVPLYFIGQIAVMEAMGMYSQYKEGGLAINQQFLVEHLPQSWQQAAITLIDNASKKASVWAQSFTLDIQAIVSNIAGFFFLTFILFFSIYYLLKDNEKIKNYFDDLLPLPAKRVNALFERIGTNIDGIVKGSFLNAIMQGFAALVGFLLSGLPQPILWSALTVISAFVPAVGTSLVLIPAIIFLLLFKSLTSAIILTVWFLVVHQTLNNIVGPKLISAKASMHPLITLLSILGGLTYFGAFGFLFGPIVAGITIALIDEYKIYK